MSYPRQLITLAQNFIDESEDNVELQENRFNMLWSSILNFHFPVTLGYGIALEISISGTIFFIVKVISELDDVVVVAALNSSSDETEAEMDALQAELAEFIKERFWETRYPSIYGIGGVGLSWSALKVDKTDVNQPMTIVDSLGLVTSNDSFSILKAIVDEVGAMASQRPATITASSSNNSSYHSFTTDSSSTLPDSDSCIRVLVFSQFQG